MSTSPKKVALITGANRGLGYKAAEKLAGLGYHVILTSRSVSSGAEAVARIHQKNGGQAEAMVLDLSSQDSVRKFAKDFLAKGLPLDLLINNAGVMSPERKITADGFELTFASNHLGHFLLTNLLLPHLIKSAPARIVVVSSRMHMPASWNKPAPDFDFDNLKGEKYYSDEVFYKNTKLANMWFTYELSRRLEGTGVTCNALCPGFVPETLAANQTKLIGRLVHRFVLPLLPFARSAETASKTYVTVATDPSLAKVTGKFLMDAKDTPSSEESYDKEKALRLWNLSAKWCGIPADQNFQAGKPAVSFAAAAAN